MIARTFAFVRRSPSLRPGVHSWYVVVATIALAAGVGARVALSKFRNRLPGAQISGFLADLDTAYSDDAASQSLGLTPLAGQPSWLADGRFTLIRDDVGS